MLSTPLSLFVRAIKWIGSAHEHEEGVLTHCVPQCFDTEWYLKNYPEAKATTSAYAHYDAIGWRNGYNPCSHFWTHWYLEKNPDVLASGMNPLIHYENHGEEEGRSPSPLFDPHWYTNRHRSELCGMRPLAHYITTGRSEGLHTTAQIALEASLPQCFDEQWYIANYPEAAGAASAYEHYDTVGWRKGYDPCSHFWTTWYVEKHPEVLASGMNPLRHYVMHGVRDGWAPSPLFDVNWYLHQYQIKLDGLNPLAHYLSTGRARGLHTSERIAFEAFTPQCFDAGWYLDSYPEVAESTLSAYAHYDAIGWRKGYDPCSHFWTTWYLEKYPDVLASGMNPLIHYEKYGAKEGRTPSPMFDVNWYVNRYRIKPDGINPLAHYLATGRTKGFCTTEPIALEAFRRGERAFDSSLMCQTVLDWRIERAGQQAYFEGALWDGRSFAAKTGVNLIETPELKAIGESMANHCAICLPPYFAKFDDVFVIPGSTLIFVNDGVINDEIVACRNAGLSLKQQKIPDRVWVKNNRIAVKYNIEMAPRIKEGIHLFKEYAANYFHFVCELMPRLFLIEKMGLSVDVPLLVADDLDVRLYEIIETIKNPARKIVKLKRNVPYAVGALFYLSDLANITDVYNEKPLPKHTFLPVRALKDIAKKITSRVNVVQSGGRKIYLPREGASYRNVVNEFQIVEALLQDGFEIVNLRALTFAAQVTLFSSAEVIVAPTGAALTNLLWCRPGTKVIVLNSDHPYTNKTFWDSIAETVGVHIHYLEGKRSGRLQGVYGVHDDFTVDIADLRVAVR